MQHVSGVVCGYCIEPTDAYLFLQINNGNCLSIPYAKGFGWGAELNLENIFTRAFGSPEGQGYPTANKASQNRNAGLLDDFKQRVAKPLPEIIRSLDPQFVKEAITPEFLACFDEGCKDPELKALVHEFVD